MPKKTSAADVNVSSLPSPPNLSDLHFIWKPLAVLVEEACKTSSQFNPDIVVTWRDRMHCDREHVLIL